MEVVSTDTQALVGDPTSSSVYANSYQGFLDSLVKGVQAQWLVVEEGFVLVGQRARLVGMEDLLIGSVTFKW